VAAQPEPVAAAQPEPVVVVPEPSVVAEPAEDLEALPSIKTASPVAPKRPARNPAPRLAAPAAEAATCVPDRAWKAARGQDLQDLTKLAAQNGYMDEFERLEPELGRKVREAEAAAECAAVGRQIDGLVKRYHRSR
jgi:hypothetical protein